MRTGLLVWLVSGLALALGCDTISGTQAIISTVPNQWSFTAREEPLETTVAAASVAATALQTTAPTDWVIYGDTISPPFTNWSWGDYQLATTDVVHSGSAAIRLNPSNWGGIRLHTAALDLSMFSAIDFWINAGAQGSNTNVSLILGLNDGSRTQPVEVRYYGPGATLPSWQWVHIRIPMVDVAPPNLVVTDIILEGSSGNQSNVYIDDVQLLTSRAGGWLYTAGNKIQVSTGYNWHGRGANIQDPRSCGACNNADPWAAAAEVNRRIDTLVDSWGANFIRLTLESDYVSSILTDTTYLQTIENIVQHIGTKWGVYVELSLWLDPSLTSAGWPTAQTVQVWQKLAATFANTSYVLFGLVNEPQNNWDGSQDAQVWQGMNTVVAAIRGVESLYGNHQHIILVQGTGGWARRLDYYVNHPITAAGGANIAYEVHVYDSASNFWTRFGAPSQSIPVVISEYGPATGSMTPTDCQILMQQAKQYEVPYMAWTFHENCPPNLLEAHASGCALNMWLQPTAWGQMVINDLAQPW